MPPVVNEARRIGVFEQSRSRKVWGRGKPHQGVFGRDVIDDQTGTRHRGVGGALFLRQHSHHHRTHRTHRTTSAPSAGASTPLLQK